jgi:hypothetical protein
MLHNRTEQQQLESLSFLLHSICEQYCSTSLLLQQTFLPAGICALSCNLQSLRSQLSTVLEILKISSLCSPTFHYAPSLLSSSEICTLYSNCRYYSTHLWQTLTYPSSYQVHSTTIQFLLLLDSYISQYILPYGGSEETVLLSQFIDCRKKVASPSVSFQVSHFEITVDPYLQSLQHNYYFPLSLGHYMGTEESESFSPSQPVHLNSKSNQSLPKTLTVEDSVDVISDLIREIQANDTEMDMEESSPVCDAPHIIKPSKVSNSSLRFSLLQKSSLTGRSSSNIAQLKQFFHCLSSISSTTILPICPDNPVSPLRTTSQINELS